MYPVGRDGSIDAVARRAGTIVTVASGPPEGCGASFLLRSPWVVLILFPLFLLFLFRHLLLLAFFLVFLATFVSHAAPLSPLRLVTVSEFYADDGVRSRTFARPKLVTRAARMIRNCNVAGHAASRATRYSWCSPRRIGVATTRQRPGR